MTEIIAAILLGFLLLSMLLILLFLAKWRGLFDQVLAINAIGTLAVGLIASIGLWLEQDYFVDIALLYALINFVASIAVLRLFNRDNPSWISFFKRRDS